MIENETTKKRGSLRWLADGSCTKEQKNFLALLLAFESSRACFKTGRAKRLAALLGVGRNPLISPADCEPTRFSIDLPVCSFAAILIQSFIFFWGQSFCESHPFLLVASPGG